MNITKILTKSKKIIKEEGLFSFLRKAGLKFLKPFKPFLLPYFIYKLKQEKSKNTPENLINFKNFKISKMNIISASQIKKEILELLEILKKIEPKMILEIGTARGGTLFLFTQVAHSEAKIISIDLPGGKFGGGYPKWKIPLYKSFGKDRQKIYLIREDSCQLSTLEKVKSILKDEKLDFLFIDGDHTYLGVKKDFQYYSELVKEGGIIALHDIAPHKSKKNIEVPKFWREIKSKYRITEIVSDWNQGCCGIGLIWKELS